MPNLKQHGYPEFCASGSCCVCNTPWPIATQNPIQKRLASLGYYESFTRASWGGIVPKGISGEELLRLIEDCKEEYKAITRGVDIIEECRKRGALEGYEKLT